MLCNFRTKGADIQARTRQAVKNVIPCDILKENPLDPLELESFDCIILALVLDAACLDQESYLSAVKNCVRLVKPGGYIIQESMLGQTYYKVGKEKFFALKLDMELIRRGYKEAGCDIENIMSNKTIESDAYCDSTTWCLVIARKST